MLADQPVLRPGGRAVRDTGSDQPVLRPGGRAVRDTGSDWVGGRGQLVRVHRQ